jgi:uncharacterized protein
VKKIVDKEYLSIVQDILNHEEFKGMDNIKHHNTTRYDHCLKVSYYSYKVAKALRLKYVDVARGGLLHDFFNDRTVYHDKVNEKIKLYTFEHPKLAVNNAKKYFDITELEEDIIRSHMFPIDIKIPKFAESWIVSSVDKVIGTFEFGKKASRKLSYAAELALLFIINMIK